LGSFLVPAAVGGAFNYFDAKRGEVPSKKAMVGAGSLVVGSSLANHYGGENILLRGAILVASWFLGEGLFKSFYQKPFSPSKFDLLSEEEQDRYLDEKYAEEEDISRGWDEEERDA